MEDLYNFILFSDKNSYKKRFKNLKNINIKPKILKHVFLSIQKQLSYSKNKLWNF